MTKFKATRAYRKALEYFQNKGHDAWSWVLINDNTQKVVYANTYGDTKKKDTKLKEFPINKDKLAKKLKEFEETDISECPIAEHDGPGSPPQPQEEVITQEAPEDTQA